MSELVGLTSTIEIEVDQFDRKATKKFESAVVEWAKLPNLS